MLLSDLMLWASLYTQQLSGNKIAFLEDLNVNVEKKTQPPPKKTNQKKFTGGGVQADS